MRITYVSNACPDTAYEIEADRFGNYSIKAAGRVVKRVTSVTNYLGKPRWGSKTLEMKALEDAKAAIERFSSAAG